MLRALFLALATFGLALATASAGAVSDPDPNAALKYWQAFSTLPKFTDAEQAKIREYLTSPLDDRARQIVTQADYSLTMLHQGAALRRCDWGSVRSRGSTSGSRRRRRLGSWPPWLACAPAFASRRASARRPSTTSSTP